MLRLFRKQTSLFFKPTWLITSFPKSFRIIFFPRKISVRVFLNLKFLFPLGNYKFNQVSIIHRS